MKSLIFISFFMFWAAPAVAQPKVISLDYCSDQYVLALADREQILALSVESQNSHSFYRDRAEGIPQGRAELEDIFSKTPDVVVRHWAGGPRVAQILMENDVDVISARFGFSMEDTIKNIEDIALKLDQSVRGRNIINSLKSRMKEIENTPQTSLTALYVTPGGVTTGAGTLVDHIFKKAGLINHGSELGITGWGTLPLEKLTILRPDLIITGFYDHASTGVDNWTFARHDFLKNMLKTTPTISLSGALLSCNGLFLADAIERILQSPTLAKLIKDKKGLLNQRGKLP